MNDSNDSTGHEEVLIGYRVAEPNPRSRPRTVKLTGRRMHARMRCACADAV